MRLILVRHAESQHNIQGIMAGELTCPGLTEQGFTQAQWLAERLQTTKELKACTKFFASSVLRAQQTAQVLLKALPLCNIETDADLCELKLGQADGLTKAQYRAKYGKFDMYAEPNRPFAPDGESWNAFNQRVQNTLTTLAKAHPDQTVVAVTHAGFIVIAMLHLFGGLGSGERAWIDPVYTGLTEWRFADNRWYLERYNDTYHLYQPE